MGEGVDFSDFTFPSSCLVCFEDIVPSNAAAYKVKSTWHPATFCLECIEILRNSQFDKYCDDLARTDCERTRRQLIAMGPPVNVRDRFAFPEAPEADGVDGLFDFNIGGERNAKCKNAVVGVAHTELWEYQKSIVEAMESTDKTHKV
eukprot:Trichotokara_eunicae@DN4447_c0_g1_i1.p1